MGHPLVKKAYIEMDKNKNRKITKEEFVTAIRRQDKISKMLTGKIEEIFMFDKYAW